MGPVINPKEDPMLTVTVTVGDTILPERGRDWSPLLPPP